eukprot:scaffold130062_cov63-Phaeocystis_antarctica.AAC.4
MASRVCSVASREPIALRVLERERYEGAPAALRALREAPLSSADPRCVGSLERGPLKRKRPRTLAARFAVGRTGVSLLAEAVEAGLHKVERASAMTEDHAADVCELTVFSPGHGGPGASYFALVFMLQPEAHSGESVRQGCELRVVSCEGGELRV